MNFSIDYEGTVTVEGEIIKQWPVFEVTDAATRQRLEKSHNLRFLLTSREPALVIWRLPFPPSVIRNAQRFDEDLLTQLLGIAQMSAGLFNDWAEECPALLAYLAVLRVRDAQGLIDWYTTDLYRYKAFLLGWRGVLPIFGMPATEETLRLLRRIPARDCNQATLWDFLEHLKSPYKQRIMRHCQVLTGNILNTLRLPENIADANLLDLRDKDVRATGLSSVRRLCSEIVRMRHLLGLSPEWPYAGFKVGIVDLIEAFQTLKVRVEIHDGHLFAENIPPPPVKGESCDEIEIHPLSTLRALCLEDLEMQSGVGNLACKIIGNCCYAYRMEKPTRATVILKNVPEGWAVLSIQLADNGDADSDTRQAVAQWLMRNGGADVHEDR
jgi:hypothetical protein